MKNFLKYLLQSLSTPRKIATMACKIDNRGFPVGPCYINFKNCKCLHVSFLKSKASGNTIILNKEIF